MRLQAFWHFTNCQYLSQPFTIHSLLLHIIYLHLKFLQKTVHFQFMKYDIEDDIDDHMAIDERYIY